MGPPLNAFIMIGSDLNQLLLKLVETTSLEVLELLGVTVTSTSCGASSLEQVMVIEPLLGAPTVHSPLLPAPSAGTEASPVDVVSYPSFATMPEAVALPLLVRSTPPI